MSLFYFVAALLFSPIESLVAVFSLQDFHSWNQVFIKYCSGDLHMGQQTAQGQSLKGLQFSGHHILDGVLHTLLGGDFGLSKV